MLAKDKFQFTILAKNLLSPNIPRKIPSTFIPNKIPFYARNPSTLGELINCSKQQTDRPTYIRNEGTYF